jgi:secreted PhoX family phosphatase
LRWGDPLFDKSPHFDPESPSAHAQELQFGYNNDFLAIIVTDRLGQAGLLCCNHEFTNREIMFPPSASEAEEREALEATMAAQGLSVVELNALTSPTALVERGAQPANHSPDAFQTDRSRSRQSSPQDR